MPPDRGRASQACTACRKQKTRCYASGNGRGACLRCERLQLSCSLDNPVSPGHCESGRYGDDESTSYGDRLRRLERIVQTVEERLDTITPRPISSIVSSSQASLAHRSQLAPVPPAISSRELRFTSTPAEDAPLSNLSPAPVFVIRDAAREVGAGQHDQQTANSPANRKLPDIIDNGLLGSEDASALLALFVLFLFSFSVYRLSSHRFLEHYGRWVVFMETTSPDALLAEVRKSPLLLCACCLIAVRHTTQEHASRLAPRLFQEVKSLLSTALLVVPQSIEFFQAALIMSLWSTTIGQALLSIDSWILSGFALQHCLSSDLFVPITTVPRSAALSRPEIDRWFIWNHLCLVHLQYSHLFLVGMHC
jgi:hypothetical protein